MSCGKEISLQLLRVLCCPPKNMLVGDWRQEIAPGSEWVCECVCMVPWDELVSHCACILTPSVPKIKCLFEGNALITIPRLSSFWKCVVFSMFVPSRYGVYFPFLPCLHGVCIFSLSFRGILRVFSVCVMLWHPFQGVSYLVPLLPGTIVYRFPISPE